ncbi:unnamed protein product [Dovyalis caffra]|uniref:Pectinesterase inhibitor domain-containing protein n=1 Tax=Dovyalis caffra TaxID=77055 RepID=A0AAV1SA25_9ROSI|nr:unnamed protein product [Dovyalis caffra]
MSHNSRHSIDSCTLQLHSWRPFLDSDPNSYKPYASSRTLTKRPCLSDRATSFHSNIDSIDISKLSLLEDENTNNNSNKPISATSAVTNGPYKRGSLGLIERKRRRRGSRSVSGRSSDRSGTRRCCSVGAASAAHGTCSDFPVAVGTDSSGELFVNGDANWASDVSEAKNSIKEREEKEILLGGGSVFGNLDSESGYGSEPGYRGDAEFGYGDEVDEEEDDARLLFWGHHFQDSKMEMVGENTFDPKNHHRCRRKKHDCRMVDSNLIAAAEHVQVVYLFNIGCALYSNNSFTLVVPEEPLLDLCNCDSEALEESHEAEEHESAKGWVSNNGDTYVREACSVTRYHNLCIHSLASFSNSARRSPSRWARAGVSVTICEANNASQYLNRLKKFRIMGSRNRIALSDCIECFQDAIANLHKSLGILRKLDAANFDKQMGDLTTWLSAALTDEDTCLDGFEDQNSKQVKMLQNQVSRVTYITSNALALVNKLAATGLGSLNGP